MNDTQVAGIILMFLSMVSFMSYFKSDREVFYLICAIIWFCGAILLKLGVI